MEHGLWVWGERFGSAIVDYEVGIIRQTPSRYAYVKVEFGCRRDGVSEAMSKKIVRTTLHGNVPATESRCDDCRT